MPNENLMTNGSVFMPASVSTFSDKVDFAFNVLMAGSAVLFLLMLAVGLYFLVRYRRKSADQKAEGQIIHGTAIEITWTVVPLIICMGIFWWGYKGYLDIVVPPDDAMEIQVIGKKWLWEFEYPMHGIKVMNEIVVPVDTPVKLVMLSEDVIHSFFIPNFRTKKDVLPNRYTKLWFEATEIGRYQVFCTEFCGDGHSNMLADLVVLSREDYDAWLKKGSSTESIPLDELGDKLYTSKACNTCHSLDGSPGVGPSWKGVFGSKRQLADGSEVIVDENYLRESIVDPAVKVVEGYAPIMPTYAGMLSDREINAIIEKIKSVK